MSAPLNSTYHGGDGNGTPGNLLYPPQNTFPPTNTFPPASAYPPANTYPS